MFNCSEQITNYHDEEVNLSTTGRSSMKKNRDANRKRLKAGLVAEGSPSPVGCHTQGSYAMRTMIQDPDRDYDIDDGVYFRKADLKGPRGAALTPLQVRQMVCNALSIEDKFTTPPAVLKNCVRVYYSEGHHVDIPAYRVTSVSDPWTGQDQETYELASSDWKSSDPLAVTKWFNVTNSNKSPDGTSSNGGQFRRVVRLLKKFAKSRNSWKASTASGFMLTKLAEECFVPSPDRDDVALYLTLVGIANRLKLNEVINHPVLAKETLTNTLDGRPTFFKNKLEDNLTYLDPLITAGCSFDEAMKAWGKFFGCDWFSRQDQSSDGDIADNAMPPSSAVKKQGGGRYA